MRASELSIEDMLEMIPDNGYELDEEDQTWERSEVGAERY